jgi:hypothetical protein
MLCLAFVLHAQAPSDAVEADAMEYARMAVRHDSLLIKLGANSISAEEIAELDRLKARGQEIKSKYTPGRASPEDIAAYTQRSKELSVSVVQPGVRKAAEEFGAQRKSENAAQASSGLYKIGIAIAVVAVAVAIPPVIYLLLLLALTRRGGHSSRQYDDPYLVPGPLERINLLGKTLKVGHTYGRVTKRDLREWVWVKTIINTGKSYGADGVALAPWQSPSEAVRSDASTSSVDRIVVKFYEYSMETPNGKATSVTVREQPSDVEVGNLFSVIRDNRTVLACYNHTTGRFVRKSLLTNRFNRNLWVFIWVACAVVAIMGYYWIDGNFVTPGATVGIISARHAVWYATALLILLAIPYVTGFRKAIHKHRDRQLKKLEPQWLAFFKNATEPLTTHFAALDRQEARAKGRTPAAESRRSAWNPG